MKIPQLPGNTQFTQLPGNNSVVCLQTTNQAVDPNRFCFLCKFAQALLGTWVCSGCMGKCWSCEKTDGTLRFGLYWTCDECENNKKCLFCELENADLFHYGAPVCETCKGRFRSYNGLKAGGRTSQPKPCDKGGICANLSACTGCWAAKCLPVWKDICKL